MDVFELRNCLVEDYGSYVRSFIRIKDARIEEEVKESLDEGLLWPDPLIQLNPSFETGDRIDDLVDEGILHEECARIFRAGKDHGDGVTLRLHRHQSEAVRIAHDGHATSEAPNPYDATLALHACVPDGEKVERDTLLADAARELGYPQITRKVRRVLNKTLNVEHNAGRLRTDWERVWRPRK